MIQRRNAGLPVLPRLRDDVRGMTLVEFGLVLPVFFLMLFGLFDLGQMMYARAMLAGAVEEAGRAASLEIRDVGAADDRVEQAVQRVAPGARVRPTRVSYYDFADIARPERWNDQNRNGTCDNRESYTDENGNGRWDADIGVTQTGTNAGGAGDVVLYTVSITYDRLFKVPFLPGSTQQTLSATTVKKNQPFADQTRYGSAAGVCA